MKAQLVERFNVASRIDPSLKTMPKHLTDCATHTHLPLLGLPQSAAGRVAALLHLVDVRLLRLDRATQLAIGGDELRERIAFVRVHLQLVVRVVEWGASAIQVSEPKGECSNRNIEEK